VDVTEKQGGVPRSWRLLGNTLGERSDRSLLEADGRSLRIIHSDNGLRASIEISLPGPSDAAALWTITIENTSNFSRAIKVVPYVEWVLNSPEADRNHTQYNRLFAEMEYTGALQGVLAWDKHAGAMGLLASDVPPEGFLSSRIDFIGRGRSLRSP